MKTVPPLVVAISAMTLLPAKAAIVPGTADLWLAGMPDRSTASGDSAPAQSPPLAGSVTPGQSYSFTVSGWVNYVPASSGPPPDGDFLCVHAAGAENGIATLTAPVSSLIGVFLGPSQPNLTSAPAGLDFGAIGLDFTSLSPALQQPFFIGDGRTSGGVTQQFIAPAGSTRLFLGSVDGTGWNNNSGQFDVVITGVPEPSTYLAGLGALGMLGVFGWRNRK